MAPLPFRGILLVSDMDGTLLDSSSRVSRENQAALEHFVRYGGLFTVATGRMEKALQRYLPLLPINIPVILYNGAVIYDFKTEKVLWKTYLSEEIETIVRDLDVTFPGLGIEVFQGTEVYFLQQNEETQKHCTKEGFLPRILPVDQTLRPWIKVILAAEPAKLALVEEYLAPRQSFFRMVYSEPQFLELLPPEASKGQALKKLVQLLGRNGLKIVALGDNLNDLDMIQTADLGIAVANAHPHLQKAARFLYGHHDENALAQVVEHLEKKII